VYAEGVTFAHAPAPAAGPYRPPQGPPPAGQAYPYPGVPQPGGGYPGGPYQGGAQPGGQQAAAHHQGGPYAGFQGGPYPGQGGPYQGQGGRPGGPGPWQGQSAPGSSSSSGGNRGLMVALGAIGGVVLLVGGIFLTVTLTNRTGGTSGTGAASPEVFAQTGAPSSSAPASPTPTPMPSPTGTIKLPGLETVVYENADDPIKLSSYRFDEGRNVYLRNGDRFTKTSKYLEIAYNDGMTRFVGTDAQFDTSNYATVSIVDRASGDSRTVRTVKSPQYVWGPAWSPDGTKLLFTVHSDVGGKVSHRGFGIVDTTTGKWTFSRVKDTDVGEWSYFWRGDGQAVGTWAVDGSKEAIRFYNLDGTVQRSLENIGSPLAVSSYDVSPDGTRLLTLCERKGSEVCVWAVADGREAARVRFPTELLIGWYDDDHLAGWRKAGTGYEAVVFDLRGNVVRLLATATEEQYKAAFLQYTRQN